MKENEIGRRVVQAAYDVHVALGPGLLESSYEHCLIHELQSQGLEVKAQCSLPIQYKGNELDCGYRLDLLINDKVIVELKAVEALTDVHLAQILTYLRLSDKRLGFLINFNTALIKHGIRRVVNKL